MDDVVRLGQDIYDRTITPRLSPEDDLKYVTVSIDSGEYEIDRNCAAAIKRMPDREPDADVFLAKVGQPTAAKFRKIL